jgi:hypothetical protein
MSRLLDDASDALLAYGGGARVASRETAGPGSAPRPFARDPRLLRWWDGRAALSETWRVRRTDLRRGWRRAREARGAAAGL